MKLHGIHHRKIEILQQYWPLERWIAVISPVRFKRQAQHHQHLQHAVLSTQGHMAAAATLQRRAIMLGEDQKSNKNFSLKMLSGKGLSLPALWKIIVERKVVNWMVMKDYSKNVLLPPDIIILVSSCEARSIQFTKTFKTDYSLQFILRSATHPNTQSGFDKGPAFTGLVIFSRDGKQTDVLKKRSACRLWGSQAHFRMAWGSKGTDTTGDWQKAWLGQKPCS